MKYSIVRVRRCRRGYQPERIARWISAGYSVRKALLHRGSTHEIRVFFLFVLVFEVAVLAEGEAEGHVARLQLHADSVGEVLSRAQDHLYDVG
jgi:hypothetical protein